MKKKKEELNKVDSLFLLSQKKLSSASLSIKKIKEFLKKNGGSKKEIEEVIAKLKRYSFIDEEEIVNNVISYCDVKHYGFNRIVKMLKEREIDPKRVEQLQRSYEREIKESKITTKRLVKRYKKKNTANLKQSVYSSLIRYGFDDDIASLRASEVSKTTTEELNMLKLEYDKLYSSFKKKLKGRELKDAITNKLLTKGFKLIDIRKVGLESNEMD